MDSIIKDISSLVFLPLPLLRAARHKSFRWSHYDTNDRINKIDRIAKI
jgi:hypothetical protein